MKILMMTNTYTPIVGGLERSIQTFTEAFRRRGHKVMIVAPSFKGMPEKETGVIRLPAIQKFNRTDFSVELPVPGILEELFDSFKPDVVHAHHPFLVGDLALRLSGQYAVPLIFTYHTMFEQYTSYFALDNEMVRTFVIELAAGYANLTDRTITPSESVRDVLRQRGVKTDIAVVPTGVDIEAFSRGNGARIREKFGIPGDAVVFGYAGRLSPEKNLAFTGEAMAVISALHPEIRFLIIGDGPSREKLETTARDAGVESQWVFTGVLKGEDMIDGYHAMDAFVFASKSETQGMVVTEAMAAGIPVIGLDAPGIREVILDKENGRLVTKESLAVYAAALEWFMKQSADERQALSGNARKRASAFTVDKCADKAMGVYEEAIAESRSEPEVADSPWNKMMNRVRTEWEMLSKLGKAAGETFKKTVSHED